MSKHNYTHLVEGDYLDVWQCNDCGAHAATKETVDHHTTCIPGEAQEWEDYYEGIAMTMEDQK